MAKTQLICKDGKYVNAAVMTRLNPGQLRVLAEWMDEHGLADDLLDEKYQDPTVNADSQPHFREVLANFFANITRDEVFHGAQKLGGNIGAVRAPDELLDDPHLADRGFWTEVEYPELGESLKHPGPAAIFNGSPWQISRRAPLIGEHNEEVLCGELGLTPEELAVLSEGGVI